MLALEQKDLDFKAARLARSSEARIARAAFTYSPYYPEHAWSQCERLGISRVEILEGFTLGREMAEERRLNVIVHGDPAYGSWGVFGKPVEHPIQDLLNIWLLGPQCTQCHALAETVAMQREIGDGTEVCCG